MMRDLKTRKLGRPKLQLHKLLEEHGAWNGYPVCPLRSIETIKKAINYSIKNNKNCFSACEYDFHITFGFLIRGNNWKAAFNKSPMTNGSTQSQSQKMYYHPTGVINCLYVRSLSKNTKSIYQKALPVVVSKNESFDLDTEEDLELMKKIYPRLNKRVFLI